MNELKFRCDHNLIKFIYDNMSHPVFNAFSHIPSFYDHECLDFYDCHEFIVFGLKDLHNFDAYMMSLLSSSLDFLTFSKEMEFTNVHFMKKIKKDNQTPYKLVTLKTYMVFFMKLHDLVADLLIEIMIVKKLFDCKNSLSEEKRIQIYDFFESAPDEFTTTILSNI